MSLKYADRGSVKRKGWRLDNTSLIPSKRILVVDDDESIRDLCALVLRTAGYGVDTAVNGADGLSKLAGQKYALVLSDVNMPELDGVEFFGIVSASFPETAFVFMTADAAGEVLSVISASGIKCLAKPFRIAELIEAVEGIMSRVLASALGRSETGSRKEGRLSFTDACALASPSGTVEGALRDISPHGIRASYPGKPIPAGERVHVKVSLKGMSFVRGGHAVWTGEEKGVFVSGIELGEPMPVSSIIGVMPDRV